MTLTVQSLKILLEVGVSKKTERNVIHEERALKISFKKNIRVKEFTKALGKEWENTHTHTDTMKTKGTKLCEKIRG